LLYHDICSFPCLKPLLDISKSIFRLEIQKTLNHFCVLPQNQQKWQ
jgi:hypothetical protein